MCPLKLVEASGGSRADQTHPRVLEQMSSLGRVQMVPASSEGKIQRCNSSQRFSALTAVTRQHFKVEQARHLSAQPSPLTARQLLIGWNRAGMGGATGIPPVGTQRRRSHADTATLCTPTIQLSGQRDRGKKPSMYSQASPYSPTIQTASCSAVLLSAGSSQRADVLRQAPLDLRDEIKHFGRRLTCGEERRLVPVASRRFGL
ncbi:hypothetical protein NQZ68_002633 [Dissostichus eleginoides]|nr:hypothetical protein NQZ68_002633 [Dissostichus eleginoides]